ncbi:MAG: cysteine desulfurase family protein [Pirellulaceae bacterium]
MNRIYLDANSTTRLDERVQQAMGELLADNYVNPASQHRPGQIARSRLERARAELRQSLGAAPGDRLLLTSGGTESNNLALIGLARTWDDFGPETPEIIISPIEHPSVLGAAAFLQSRGFLVHRLPVSGQGVVQIGALAELLTPQTRLVSLMLANNETGVIQEVETAARICAEVGVPLHCDAVQAVGKIPVHFGQLGVTAMTITAHKLHGPRGIGGLLVKEHVELQPIMFGGVQQLGLRPGTEDVALAGGFSLAVKLAVDELAERSVRMADFRDHFEARLVAEVPDLVIHGAAVDRAPHTSNLSFPGGGSNGTVNRQALMMAADADGVAISTGSACTSGSSEPSHVLTAMGCNEAVIESSIRVSLSALTTAAEIDLAARRIINAVKRLRQQKSR